MLLRNAFPNPAPSDAPFTRPAMSVICKYAGYSLGGFHSEHRWSYRSSGTAQRASFGSMVQKGKFSAAMA